MLRRGIRSFSTAFALRAKIEVGTVPPVAANRFVAEQSSNGSGSSGSNGSRGSSDKKRRPFRRFVITSTLLVSLFYCVGSYASLDNDTIYFYFTEYVPGAFKLVTMLEDARVRVRIYNHDSGVPAQKGRLDSLSLRADDPSNRITPTVLGSTNRKTTNLNIEPKAAEKTADTPVVTDTPVAAKASSEPEISSKPETPAKTPSLTAISAVLPQLTDLPDLDPSLSSLLDTFNKVIVAAEKNMVSDSDVAQMLEQIRSTSAKIAELRVGAKNEYEQNLAKHLEATEAYRHELESRLSEELERRQQAFLDVSNRRAAREVESVRSAVVAEANNRLRMLKTQLTEQFADSVSKLVDNERKGRLANLNELSKQLTRLQKQVADLGAAIESNDQAVALFVSLAEVQSRLQAEAQPLREQFVGVKRAAAAEKDELMDAALSAVPEDALSYGVLSHQQLAARFALIAPKIRRARLVPENAGVGGHLSSVVLSNLLVKKQGLPIGDDTESVLARAETYLSQGQIVEAIAEVNSLRGWPREIAADWLAEARKRGEIEFLVRVLAAEGRVRSSSN